MLNAARAEQFPHRAESVVAEVAEDAVRVLAERLDSRHIPSRARVRWELAHERGELACAVVQECFGILPTHRLVDAVVLAVVSIGQCDVVGRVVDALQPSGSVVGVAVERLPGLRQRLRGELAVNVVTNWVVPLGDLTLNISECPR